MSAFNFLLVVLVLILVTSNAQDSFSQRRRRTKELEEKISKLDDGTKQRVFAMKASGMPHDSIAEKIAYQAGGKTTAKRIVDAMLEDPVTRKPGNKRTTSGNQKTSSSQKSAQKKTGGKR